MSYKIYLVDDEEKLNNVLTSYLKNEGWIVKSFFNGKTALEVIEDKPDLWILDIMLPDIDGFELIKKIKEYDIKTPVIFISARDAQIDRVIGLDMGSDDYIPKPFLPRELIIRVKKLLERNYGNKKINLFPYTIDKKKRAVYYNGKEIDFTAKEFDLLILLSENNFAFSREQILDEVWGDDYFGSDRVVDDTIRRIRKKIPKINIETIYGFGYRMIKNEEK
ncbi:DNA-binding response regulator [Tepiditoga spiralis]|uniref:DNA-binding response regulator n=1 Tax=Tepiditoga spiralis TaxID=2108365 RepID=A0A7G1G7J1_9BACT|nr:response regulator transcription factor [Tepiditoga spiralis]BBE30853.1 DNA-binding response regulator [Tepiditoga spiralis]